MNNIIMLINNSLKYLDREYLLIIFAGLVPIIILGTALIMVSKLASRRVEIIKNAMAEKDKEFNKLLEQYRQESNNYLREKKKVIKSLEANLSIVESVERLTNDDNVTMEEMGKELANIWKRSNGLISDYKKIDAEEYIIK